MLNLLEDDELNPYDSWMPPISPSTLGRRGPLIITCEDENDDETPPARNH